METAGHKSVPAVLKSVVTLNFIPCHRLPNRSLIIGGKPFLCYRCLSILMGYLAIPLLLLCHLPSPGYLGILLQLPMLADGFTQYRKWRVSNQFLRIVTGLLSGIGQSVIVVFVAREVTRWMLGWV